MNFFVGRAMNPAYQNPDLPINLSIKFQLVRDLAKNLERMGKIVTVKYRKRKIIMRKFDTNVQLLKYRVLKEVARLEFQGKLKENLLEIPKTIMPGPRPHALLHLQGAGHH